LSSQIAEAIAALKANASPTPDQAAEFRAVHLEILGQLEDFARDFEQARARNERCIPLWGGAGAAARLYRWLEVGRRRPTAGLGETVVRVAGARS
jgi:hypothetical protein